MGLAGSTASGGLGFSASCGPNDLHLPKINAPRAGGARGLGSGMGTTQLQHPDALNVSPPGRFVCCSWHGPPEVGAAPGEGGRSPARGTGGGRAGPRRRGALTGAAAAPDQPGARREAAGTGGRSTTCGEGGCWRSP